MAWSREAGCDVLWFSCFKDRTEGQGASRDRKQKTMSWKRLKRMVLKAPMIGFILARRKTNLFSETKVKEEDRSIQKALELWRTVEETQAKCLQSSQECRWQNHLVKKRRFRLI